MSRLSVDTLTAPVRVALFGLALVLAFGAGAALGAALPALRDEVAPSTTTVPAGHDSVHTTEHALAAAAGPGHDPRPDPGRAEGSR